MSQHAITCDHELLRLSLDERLNEQQEEQLVRHLESCSACQNELERLAGQHEEWSKVSLALQQEAESRSAGSGLDVDARGESNADGMHSDGPGEPSYAHEEIGDSAVDFAVDFLEPSSAPEAIGRIGHIDILAVLGGGGMGSS